MGDRGRWDGWVPEIGRDHGGVLGWSRRVNGRGSWDGCVGVGGTEEGWSDVEGSEERNGGCEGGAVVRRGRARFAVPGRVA